MENSETKERVINLGKALAKELELDPGVDTLSRWMSHYIAEQIVKAENATGEEKAATEKRCFDTILELWEHRSLLPDGLRPFENFEPLFHALERLDPENSRPFYFPHPNRPSESEEDSEPGINDIEKLIDAALIIDQAARVVISSFLNYAAQSAADEKTIAWLQNAINSTDINEGSIVISILSKDEDDKKIKDLKSKIEKLDAFSDISNKLRNMLNDELEKISE